MERTMTVDLDKMADRVVEKALDEFTYNGKTIREWVELMVTAESVVEVRMVEEFEKLKTEMVGKYKNDQHMDNYTMGVFHKVIDNHIKELKGENNGNI